MNFFAKQILKAQLKNVPEAQRVMIMAMLERNPDLFMQISKEIKAKKKGGMNEQMAMMQVMTLHRQDLEKLAREIAKK